MSNVVMSDAFGSVFQDVTLNEAQVNVVPEPTTWLLFGTGLLGLVGLGRRKFAIQKQR